MTRTLLLFLMIFSLLILGVVQTVHAESGADTANVTRLIAKSRSLLFKSGATKQDLDSAGYLANQAYTIANSSVNSIYTAKVLLLQSLLNNRNNKRDLGMVQAQKALVIFQNKKDIFYQAEAYTVIGQHYSNNGKDLQIKISYYQKALNLFISVNALYQQLTIYKELADYQQLAGDINGALVYLRKALYIAPQLNRGDVQGIYDLLGNCLSANGDYLNGLKYGLMAVKAAENLHDNSLQLCTILNHVGLTYFSLRDYERAYDFYKKSYAVAQYYKDTDSEVTLMMNMATALIHLDRPEKALPVLNQLSQLAGTLPPDAGLNYYIDYGYSKVYLAIKDLAKANEKLLLTERYVTQMNSPVSEARAIALRIEYLMDVHQFKPTYGLLVKMQNLSRQANSATDMGNNELLWFKADSALNHYPSAVNHYERYKTIMDSVFTMKKNRQTDMLQIEYETEKKNKDIQLKGSKIALLNKQAQLQKSLVARADVTKNVTLGGSVCLMLMLGMGYNRYRLKIRSNKQLQEKQTEIIAKNHSLEKLLHENEWLLREVHHRVKNNLQIIMSLLHSQSAYLKDEKALYAVMESQHRVQAMSLIHQKLYKTSNTSAVYMPEYINDLVVYLKDSFKTGNNILVEEEIEPITLDVSQAVPIGLILNEVITNALKYAFPHSENDLLSVRFVHTATNEVELVISDNGKGLPADFNEQSNLSFGMVLIRGLTDELEGCFEVLRDAGTTVITRFKLSAVRAA
jgi:two-component system, sensor histidine kinase PdtaS